MEVGGGPGGMGGTGSNDDGGRAWVMAGGANFPVGLLLSGESV